MINKVILIGNLGRDPEIRRLESGVAVTKFPIATNENYKDKNGEWQSQTEWHDVVAWRALAEQAERVLKKGKLAYIEGKLTHRKYQDKDGNDRYITEIVANVIRALEKREAGSNSYNNSFPSEESAPAATSQTATPSGNNNPTEATVAADDDLPF